MINMRLYRRRKRSNAIWLSLSIGAALFGLLWLALILESLFYNGFSSLSVGVFTKMTPAPGDAGGLANAIVGSLIMSAIAVAAGTPIGILAGTYLAEYGRHARISFAVRFINDILLSAPSIIVGMFIYELVVKDPLFTVLLPAIAPDWMHGTRIYQSLVDARGFSAWAGAAALMLLVIPVVVRTTENMLLLVPNSLREAAAALGAPRAFVIRAVTWKAAQAGMLTGVLLAVARISGETAPLLFTAFGNNNWSLALGGPMANLPKVIFDFAMSPYEDWHKLAWAGALIITIAVLSMSVAARILESRNRR
jgi:phosphate transport system permease protein